MVLNTANLAISLDRDGEEPIYRQLIRHIRMQIESGSLPAATRLPASRDLARQLQISRISVVNAYAELRAEGFLSAHAGRGTFVAREGAAHDSQSPQNGNNNGATPDRPIRDIHSPHSGTAWRHQLQLWFAAARVFPGSGAARCHQHCSGSRWSQGA